MWRWRQWLGDLLPGKGCWWLPESPDTTRVNVEQILPQSLQKERTCQCLDCRLAAYGMNFYCFKPWRLPYLVTSDLGNEYLTTIEYLLYTGCFPNTSHWLAHLIILTLLRKKITVSILQMNKLRCQGHLTWDYIGRDKARIRTQTPWHNNMYSLLFFWLLLEEQSLPWGIKEINGLIKSPGDRDLKKMKGFGPWHDK